MTLCLLINKSCLMSLMSFKLITIAKVKCLSQSTAVNESLAGCQRKMSCHAASTSMVHVASSQEDYALPAQGTKGAQGLSRSEAPDGPRPAVAEKDGKDAEITFNQGPDAPTHAQSHFAKDLQYRYASRFLGADHVVSRGYVKRMSQEPMYEVNMGLQQALPLQLVRQEMTAANEAGRRFKQLTGLQAPPLCAPSF